MILLLVSRIEQNMLVRIKHKLCESTMLIVLACCTMLLATCVLPEHCTHGLSTATISLTAALLIISRITNANTTITTTTVTTAVTTAVTALTDVAANKEDTVKATAKSTAESRGGKAQRVTISADQGNVVLDDAGSGTYAHATLPLHSMSCAAIASRFAQRVQISVPSLGLDC
jgi:hypothetical protein